MSAPAVALVVIGTATVKNESKKSLLTNQDFDWTGAHTIKVYKISTGAMNDYDRNGENTSTNWSRYGAVQSLDATVEEFVLKKDRSFTFAIDKLDNDETAQQLAGATALARQQREKVIPEIDSYVYGVMAAGAGTKPAAVALTAENFYDEIVKASSPGSRRWRRQRREECQSSCR